MLLNRLIVTPSLETTAYFKTIMASSPIELDVDNFSVDIITTSGAFETKPNNTYSALCGTMNIWYDPARMESSLILPLFSNSLTHRFDEIADTGAMPYWYPLYNPHLVMKFAMPSRHKHFRGFLNSISTTLATSNVPLTFDSEYAAIVDQIHPLNYEYNVNCQSGP
jgi:hypothetical protein